MCTVGGRGHGPAQLPAYSLFILVVSSSLSPGNTSASAFATSAAAIDSHLVRLLWSRGSPGTRSLSAVAGVRECGEQGRCGGVVLIRYDIALEDVVVQPNR